MNEFKDTLVLAALALVLSTAGVLSWIAGLSIPLDSSLVRGGLVFVWLGFVGGIAYVAVRRATRDVQSAYRAIERLSRLTTEDLATGLDAASLPPVPSTSPWHDKVQRLVGLLEQTQEQLFEAEQRRAALDVRARRQEAQSERISAILGSLSEPVLVVDAYDELVLANTSAQRLFDLDHQDVEKRALQQLVRCEKLIELLQETRRRGGAAMRSDEVELPCGDGQSRWYSITTSGIAAGGGNASCGDYQGVAASNGDYQGAVAVLRDISHQKTIQKRNAEFVSAVSHEMKTPLAGIKAYVELLADGDVEDEQTREEFLNVINSQADRLRRLIDNMLNLARIESGVVQVKKMACSLNELLEEALDVVKPAAEAKQIELAADLSPMYLNVHIDRDQILQTAINLLSNAIKYTPGGGRVRLRSQLADKQVEFAVEDSGVGLSPEDCARVFERFYRVQKDSQMAAGTGLGLPLAKHIVEEVHGGRLAVKSTLGQGSTFTVSLPNVSTGKDS
jgi:two-component system phosphate regulon sensor histidine kinase PhoR